MVAEMSWERCSELNKELSVEERIAFNALADGEPPAATLAMLGRLETLGLIKHDGSSLSLTDDGRALAAWFRSRPGS